VRLVIRAAGEIFLTLGVIGLLFIGYLVWGTAMRAARLFLPRRRHADRCPLSIQSTSMDVRCDAPDGST